MFRLVVCDGVREQAPGIDYTDGAIARLKVVDPWPNDSGAADSNYKMPPIVLGRARVKRPEGRGGGFLDAWVGEAA